MAANDYLRRILNARVYDVAIETPLELAPRLSARLGARLMLKREDLQPVFSFKLRGAYNKMASLPAAARARGVIAASAGNHAQGVALAARRLGCKALIVMPATTPEVKVNAVRALGAEIVLAGDSFTDAYGHALSLQRRQRLTLVHPFDDPDVIAGQRTVGMEILRQHHPREHGRLRAVFVAVGGGGLISGVGVYVKSLRADVKLIGVQTTDSNAMARSLRAGRRVRLTEVGLFSDGTAVREVGRETFRLCRRYVDEMITVDTDAVCAAIKDVFEDTRSILEPAGALAVAGAKAYAARESARRGGRVRAGKATPAQGSSRARWDEDAPTYVAITCGANMNFDRLRFVAERAEVGEKREAVFAVTIPEERGSFRRLCELVGPRHVTEFNYRIADRAQAHVFVGVQLASAGDTPRLLRAFRRAGFPAIDLTEDELAKLHLRHMVGGRSALAAHERLLHFEFPERPGALIRFLSSMSPDWNISLFHYRNQGADYGRVLVGLQVPPGEQAALARFLATLGYPYTDETANPAYQLFL